MTARSDIERLLDVWLQDGPTVISDSVVDRAIATVDRTPQVSVWRAAWRNPSMSILARVAAVAVLVVVATSALVFLSSRPATVGGQAPPVATPTPSPTPSPISSPSPTGASAPSSKATPSPSLQALRDDVTIIDTGSVMKGGVRYIPRDFLTPVSFEGVAGWLIATQVDQPLEGPNHVYINEPNDVSFDLYRPSQAITEAGASVISLPKDLVAWLQARTDLVLQAPSTIQFPGGTTGTVLEGDVKPGATTNGSAINIFCSDDAPCDFYNPNEWGVFPGDHFEWVIAMVRGAPLLIGVSATDTDWATAKPTFDALLASVQFPKGN